MAEPYAYKMRLVTGALLIVLVVDTAIKLLSGIGAAIRQRSGARVSTTAYIDLLKIVAVVLGFAVAVSVMTETDLLKLLGGIGAFAAVLMFIFKDTLHSILASLQIASWGHFREGDWISVPSFNADGTVERIGLYDITVRNWDLTVSLIPTNKVLDVATTND